MKKIYRIKQLNELLKHHDGYTIIELMAKLDVGERTIRKDLEQIQNPPYNAKFSYGFRGKERVYRYEDISFNLPLFDENDDIKRKLNAAIDVFKRYKGIPQFDWLNLCLLSIEKGSISGIDNTMSFESNDDLEGLKHIQDILDAIVNKYPIKLTYKPYWSDEKVLYVHPYHLKQFNNRWFLIGKPEHINALHNYAIDRIVSIKHLSKPYIETDIDFDEYFDDVIGVSVSDDPIEIVELMINRKRYPYIKSKPLHWSQKHIKEKDDDDYICIQLKLKPNRELVTLLLSYGPDVIVNSPTSLCNILKIKILEMYNSYY